MEDWRILLENKFEAANVEMNSSLESFRNELEVVFVKKEDRRDVNKMPSQTDLVGKVAGIFAWNIDRVAERKQKRGSMWSEYFHTRNNLYKMRLQFHPNGFVRTGTGFSIYAFLYPSESTAKISWPFRANISIKIFNGAVTNKSKIITKFCHIDKPINNPFKCCASFEFLYNELNSDGLFQNDHFTIECFVNVK